MEQKKHTQLEIQPSGSLFNRACHFVLFVHAFRKELEGRYKLDSQELKEMLARECARNEASHKEELKRHQIK